MLLILLYYGKKCEFTAEAPLDAKNLKLGVKLTAKVHQIRTHGLVLDLGGDIRGMYRFEVSE